MPRACLPSVAIATLASHTYFPESFTLRDSRQTQQREYNAHLIQREITSLGDITLDDPVRSNTNQ
jgi:hypothetical protein